MRVNGFGDELLYERGAIDNTMPFPIPKNIDRDNSQRLFVEQKIENGVMRPVL